MRQMIVMLGLGALLFLGGCDLLDPASSQVTIEATNISGSGCPVIVNLDGNNATTIANQGSMTFPTVGSGNHTLNYSTNGNGGSSGTCVYSNNGQANYSITFSTSGGHVYVGTVKENGSTAYQLSVSING